MLFVSARASGSLSGGVCRWTSKAHKRGSRRCSPSESRERSRRHGILAAGRIDSTLNIYFRDCRMNLGSASAVRQGMQCQCTELRQYRSGGGVVITGKLLLNGPRGGT